MGLTTDPNDPALKNIKSDGQQEVYLVLSAEERAKGFIRPYRDSYIHVGIRPKYPVRDLTDEEKERYTQFGYVAYEEYPPNESSSLGRFWTQAQLNSGCQTETKMGQALSETYARDPRFYGGTFCCHCQKHFPVEEFVWTKDKQRVGS